MELLIGATGTIGKHLLQHYKGRTDVRVWAHSDRSAQLVSAYDISQLHKGSLSNETSITNAFKNVDRLFLLTPYSPQQGTDEIRILEAARANGVQRIVYISLQFVGKAPSIALKQGHEQAEAWLERSGISYAAIQPPAFIDNLIGQLDAIRAGQLVYGGGTGAQIAHIESRDIAAVAAFALSSKQLVGRVAITGPESLSYADIATRLSQHLGRTVTYIDPPVTAWRDGLVSFGVPEWYADALVEAVPYYSQQQPFVDTRLIELATNRKAFPIDDFIVNTLRPLLG